MASASRQGLPKGLFMFKDAHYPELSLPVRQNVKESLQHIPTDLATVALRLAVDSADRQEYGGNSMYYRRSLVDGHFIRRHARRGPVPLSPVLHGLEANDLRIGSEVSLRWQRHTVELSLSTPGSESFAHRNRQPSQLALTATTPRTIDGEMEIVKETLVWSRGTNTEPWEFGSIAERENKSIPDVPEIEFAAQAMNSVLEAFRNPNRSVQVSYELPLFDRGQ